MFTYFRPAEKRFPTGLRLLDQCEVILTNERALLQILTNQVMVVHDTMTVDWPENWWKVKDDSHIIHVTYESLKENPHDKIKQVNLNFFYIIILIKDLQILH